MNMNLARNYRFIRPRVIWSFSYCRDRNEEF